jgi:hypothetical protein
MFVGEHFLPETSKPVISLETYLNGGIKVTVVTEDKP